MHLHFQYTSTLIHYVIKVAFVCSKFFTQILYRNSFIKIKSQRSKIYGSSLVMTQSLTCGLCLWFTVVKIDSHDKETMCSKGQRLHSLDSGESFAFLKVCVCISIRVREQPAGVSSRLPSCGPQRSNSGS